jgi:hypothetical protein
MKIKQKDRLARVDHPGAGKPEPVACDLAGRYAALRAQFNAVEVQRDALWRQVMVLELRRAAIKSALDAADTLIAVSRGVV